MALNLDNNTGSIRGPLCALLQNELEDRITIGGHPIAMGMSFKKDELELIKDVCEKI